MEKRSVLVIGGAGYIGSAVNLALHDAGYSTTVIDNLERGHRDAVPVGHLIVGDLRDPASWEEAGKHGPYVAAIHLAAIADVGASCYEPLSYFERNVAGTITLLHYLRQLGLDRLVFSSSAGVYGAPQTALIEEDHPCVPINPYGESKLMVERILAWSDLAYGLRASCLRYFNAAGADPSGRVRLWDRDESNLIPRILRSCKRGKAEVTVNGEDYATKDGTCVRDYVHVADLAAAHVLALQNLLETAESNVYNLGNEKGFSIRDVLQSIQEVTGKELAIKTGPRRLGDPATLVASSRKAQKELGWSCRYPDLNEMIRHAWEAMD
jgi:UDP-glucose 4-epimerase